MACDGTLLRREEREGGTAGGRHCRNEDYIPAESGSGMLWHKMIMLMLSSRKLVNFRHLNLSRYAPK